MKNFETAPANATIRKDSGFVLAFASRNIKIDEVVAELGQFACGLAPAGGGRSNKSGWSTRSGNLSTFLPPPLTAGLTFLPSSCCSEPALKLS